MSVESTVALPSNILTTKQYEDQQAKLRTQEEDLDRMAFLTLFTTQLKNQNPLDPMDNEAFVSQLAQFSSLEAMTGVRTSVDAMAADSKSEKFLLGSSLLGKKIERIGNLATLDAGGEISPSANLSESADSAVFTIFDAATDELVYTEDFENLPAGDVDLTWNGQNQEGDEMPAGQYKFEFVVDRGGVSTTLPLINKQVITAVSWDQTLEELKVEMEDGSVLSMAEVGRIEN
ncbi:MAG: flagellar hook capping FlgD N-terminal domain-containing protein [Gammaproteobacteria bacterium]|jgi:flagellar basal-body rod modification protein FlgD